MPVDPFYENNDIRNCNALRKVFNCFHDQIFIIDFESMCFIDANQSALTGLGYSKDELKATALHHIATGFEPSVLVNRCNTLSNVDEQVESFCTSLIRKDKSTYGVEVYLSCYNENNQKFLVASASEAHVANHATKKTDLDSLGLANISDAVVSTNPNLVITGWNKHAETMFGWLNEEAIGRYVYDMIKWLDSGVSLKEVAAQVFKNGSWKGETIARGKNGGQIHAFNSISALKNAQEQIIGTVSVIKDVTEKKKLEEQLKVLSEQMEQKIIEKTEELRNIPYAGESKKVEEKLVANEKRFRALFEHSLDGIALLSDAGVIIDVSPSIEKIVGISKEKLVNTNGLDFVATQHVPTVYNTFHSVIKEPAVSRTVECEVVTGKVRKWLECTYSNLLNQPAVNAIVLNFRDITERKEAEEQNRFKANLLNTIGQAVVATDLNGVVTYWNSAAEKIYGWTQGEAVGKSIMELTPAQQSVEQAKQIMEQLKKGQAWSGEFKVQRKDRTNFVAFVTDNPIYDSYGNLSGIVGVSSDITAAKTVENKLNESEARYRTAQSKGKLGHWECDLPDKQMFWSDEIYKIFKVSKEPINPDLDLFLGFVHPADRELMIEQVKNALAGLKGFNLYHRIILKDETIRYVHEVVDLVKDEAGRLVKVMGMIQDVTEQKLIEKGLILSEKNYRLLFDQSPVPFWMVEFATFNFLEVNQAAVSLYGYSREEFLKMNVRDIRTENDEEYFKMFNTHRVSGDPSTEVATHRKKNGEIVIVKITTNRIVYNGRDVWLATTNDITNETFFEKQLKESQEQLSLIFNSTINAMCLLKIENNSQCRIEAANDAIAEAIGMDKKKFVGFLLDEVLDPKKFQVLLYKYKKAAGTGKVEKFFAETELETGERIWDVTLVPIKGRNGEVIRLLLVCNDITDQKKFQQKLVESEQKYRILFEKSPIPMWIFDKKAFNILEVNLAAIEHYGYKKDEFCRLSLYDIRRKEEHSQLRQLGDLLSTDTVSFDTTHTKKTGEVIKVNVTASPIELENKEATLAVIVDRTEEERAKFELIESRNQLRTLASHLENIREEERINIAREIHDELGQQLTGLKMDVAWINRNLNLHPEKVRQKIKSALDLIDVAISTVRKISTALRPSMLDDLGISEALDWQGRDFSARTGINLHFSSNVMDVKFPPAISIAIFRIFQESLTNIARHANASKVVSSLNRKDNSLCLIIADNGIGFKKDEQKRKKTLGLLGMEERVIALDGTYTISGEPGKGTVVSVRVPLNLNK